MIYHVSMDDALTLQKVQNGLNIYGFHSTKVMSGKSFVSPIVSSYFPFIDRVNEISSWYYESGLYRKYKLGEYESRLFRKNRNNLRNTKDVTVDSIGEFPTSIVYGWIASAIVFVIEIISKKIQLLVKKLSAKNLKLSRPKIFRKNLKFSCPKISVHRISIIRFFRKNLKFLRLQNFFMTPYAKVSLYLRAIISDTRKMLTMGRKSNEQKYSTK